MPKITYSTADNMEERKKSFNYNHRALLHELGIVNSYMTETKHFLTFDRTECPTTTVTPKRHVRTFGSVDMSVRCWHRLP